MLILAHHLAKEMQARGWKGRRFTASFGGVAKKSGLQNRWAWCLSHALRFGQVLHGPPVYSWVFSWLACRLGCPGYLLWWSRLAAANCRHHAVQLALGKCRLLQRGQKLMTMPGQVRTIENPETLQKNTFRVRSFGVIRVRISDPRSVWITDPNLDCPKGTHPKMALKVPL